jgi:hypothetical protein
MMKDASLSSLDRTAMFLSSPHTYHSIVRPKTLSSKSAPKVTTGRPKAVEWKVGGGSWSLHLLMKLLILLLWTASAI